MFQEFNFLRVKPTVAKSWSFPLSLEQSAECPLAGNFDEATMRRLAIQLDLFPFARRTVKAGRSWSVKTPQGNALDLWMTSDGQLWAQGETTLNLVLALLLQLQDVCETLVVEDAKTQLVHNRASLLPLVHREESKQSKAVLREMFS